MNRSPTDLQLSTFLNIGDLVAGVAAPTIPVPEESPRGAETAALEVRGGHIQWLGHVVSADLKSLLTEMAPAEKAPLDRLLPQMPSPQALGAPGLDTIFQIMRDDIYGNRHKMMLLPPSRKQLIERRMETIARKVARLKGERMNRSLSLEELIRDSSRPNGRDKTLGQAAFERFTSEVAFHTLLQLFVVKALHTHGWRGFHDEDLSRLNFVIHDFLVRRSAAFNTDRHSWNFVRPNLYSWYTPTAATAKNCAQILTHGIVVNRPGFAWSDTDLQEWMTEAHSDLGLDHLEFGKDRALSQALLHFAESELGTPTHSSKIHDKMLPRKTFIPVLEGAALALDCLRSLADRFSGPGTNGDMRAQESALHHSVWGCDSEGLETHFTEVGALLLMLRRIKARDCSPPHKLPHGVRCVQQLALQFHNQEQLALDETPTAQQGTAAQIQDCEGFDQAFVLDHPDRQKSSRWMKSLSEQLPYWKPWLHATSTLGWGEAHLLLALGKLKEHGHCFYLTHRVLPDQGEGEKLRRHVLGSAVLDYFLELDEERFGPYRYLYVFTKEPGKAARDASRVRYGKFPSAAVNIIHLSQTSYQESASLQWEIVERGWEQIFVQGAAPLVRHLNSRCPKLFQLAAVQTWSPARGHDVVSEKEGLFRAAPQQPVGLEFTREGSALRFHPLDVTSPHERIAIFPHNSSDLPWLQHLLNSKVLQFWIRLQITQDPGSVKIQDLRNLPVMDLTRVQNDVVNEALTWLAQSQHTEDTLRRWMMDTPQIGCRFVAAARRWQALDRTVCRYAGLFDALTEDRVELNPESVPHFYHTALLTSLLQSPDVKAQFVKRELTSTNPNFWIIKETFLTPQLHNQNRGNPSGDRTVVHIFTKQGPQILLSVPSAVGPYINAQLQKLRDFTWGEAVGLLRVPRDIPLYVAQSSEIVRVVTHNIKERETMARVLAEASLSLFEITAEDRAHLQK